MFRDKRVKNILISNLAFALGISFLIIGLFLIRTADRQDEMTVELINFDYEDLELDYTRLANDKKQDEIELIIPPGSSGLTVAGVLDEANLISAEDFRKFLRLFDIEKRLKAGTYRFNKDDSFADILNKILIN
ncbi:MAG: hypothetical protein ACOCQO_00880 [Halanaerobiaceae bacterium]